MFMNFSLNKSEVISLKRLYYPVNTPMCHYQRQLVVDSLFINLLIALPNELDSFFVASIVMFNFRRYYFSMCILYMFFENQNFFSISLWFSFQFLNLLTSLWLSLSFSAIRKNLTINIFEKKKKNLLHNQKILRVFLLPIFFLWVEGVLSVPSSSLTLRNTSSLKKNSRLQLNALYFHLLLHKFLQQVCISGWIFYERVIPISFKATYEFVNSPKRNAKSAFEDRSYWYTSLNYSYHLICCCEFWLLYGPTLSYYYFSFYPGGSHVKRLFMLDRQRITYGEWPRCLSIWQDIREVIFVFMRRRKKANDSPIGVIAV